MESNWRMGVMNAGLNGREITLAARLLQGGDEYVTNAVGNGGRRGVVFRNAGGDQGYVYFYSVSASLTGFPFPYKLTPVEPDHT